MIGQKSIEINWKNFTTGHTTGDTTTDGGFSIGVSISDGIQTSVINPIIQPGVLNFPASPTDASTSLVGRMLAGVPNDTTSSLDMFMLARTNTSLDGTYYWWSGSALTLKRTDSTNNYAFGKNDIITFQNEVYATSNEQLVRWTADDTTFNVNFFTFSDTSAPHPALVFENNAFYGDGNLLLRQTAANAVPSTILTLNEGQVITALGIDPGSGKMLVSISSQNVSDTVPSINRVGYYNGYSNKFDKIVIVDDLITCFYPVGGIVFVFYGTRFGYWTGTGIAFIRKLNIVYDNEFLIYKGKVTNIGEIVYIAEKNRILAYGEIIPGQGKRFWYCFENIPVLNLSFVTNLGSSSSTAQNLGYSYLNDLGAPSYKFYTLDTMSIATRGIGQIYTLSYDFSRPVTFNNFVIEYVSTITASTNIADVYLGTDVLDIASAKIATVNVGTMTTTTFECPWPVDESRTFQVNYQCLAQLPIKRFTIFYTPKD